MDYSAYGGFDEIDVSDLIAPTIIMGGGRPSATTVSGRLRQMFSAVPKSNSMGKMYFSGPTKVKKLSTGEQVQNARRLAKVGAAASKAARAADIDLSSIDEYDDLREMRDDETAIYGSGADLSELDLAQEDIAWHQADESIERNVAPVDPYEEGLLDSIE